MRMTLPFKIIYGSIGADPAMNDSQLVIGVKKDETTFTQ